MHETKLQAVDTIITENNMDKNPILAIIKYVVRLAIKLRNLMIPIQFN